MWVATIARGRIGVATLARGGGSGSVVYRSCASLDDAHGDHHRLPTDACLPTDASSVPGRRTSNAAPPSGHDDRARCAAPASAPRERRRRRLRDRRRHPPRAHRDASARTEGRRRDRKSRVDDAR
jgi:hypothetical protein